MKNTKEKIYDLLIIGGGINGTGIARDAAGRGLSVVLCEQNDLASGTSSLSTKLIHGGLRYLEHREFKLVRDSLSEREVLLRNAPHLIKPLRFVLPHQVHLRPSWMIRSGLFLYDRLGKKQTLPKCEFINLETSNLGEPLNSYLKKAYAYSDCWVDDARLVISNAISAREHGADIYNYTPIKKLEVKDGIWHANDTIRARVVVNATGPWIGEFGEKKTRLVKGSHIVVPRQYPGEQAYIIQNDDKRVVFVIPFEDDYELIGTTEVDFIGDPNDAKIDDYEINYLLDIYNKTFHRKISKRDIVWDYSGVRPLVDAENKNASAVSRDYRLTLKTDAGAPSLFVFGGKITTYRKLAEDALHKFNKFFPKMGKPWTADTPLPGGDIENFDEFVIDMEKQYAWLPTALCKRYARSYGTRMHDLLQGKIDLTELGDDMGSGLYQTEIDFLKEQEWAREEDDILFRRTKLGLHRI